MLEQFVKENYGDKIEFTNSGYGGNTTLQATERIDEQIIPYDFDIIGVALGTNDWNLQNDLSTFEVQYENLINRLLNETNAALYIVTLGYFHNWKEENKVREEEYNKIIRKIAGKYNIPVVETRNAMLKYMEENSADFYDITLESDPVHPNDIGHNIWYQECKKIFVDN